MQNNHRRLLLLFILISVALRLAAAFFLGGEVEDLPGTADQVSYHTLALRVLGGHGFTFGEAWWPLTAADEPTAHWSYLYTGYLILVYALFGPDPLVARLIQVVIVGILQPLLAYHLGRRVFDGRVGLAAAAITSLYAYFIYYSANLMTESFYITSILASFYFAIQIVAPELTAQKVRWPWKPAIALGLSLAAAVLLRQLFLLFIPLLFIWIGLAGRKQAASLLLSGALVVLAILPFTAFNYARFGRFVLLNTNAGFAFFWGNHPIYGTEFKSILPHELGRYVQLVPPELRGLDEAALDQALLKRGIEIVLDDPVRYVRLSISRIPSYFMFWPSEDSGRVSNVARVASFGLLWPFMLYGLALSLFRDQAPVKLHPHLRPQPRLTSPLLLLCLFIVGYTLVHLLTWTLIRYRLPVDAILVIFAGLAMVNLAERVPVLRRLVERVA